MIEARTTDMMHERQTGHVGVGNAVLLVSVNGVESVEKHIEGECSMHGIIIMTVG